MKDAFHLTRVKGRYWLILAVGAALALLAAMLPVAAYICKLLVAFVHEVGHSIIGWLFGYPSIPTIDLLYGGGVTIQWDRQWWICLAVVAALLLLIWRYRRNVLAVSALGAALLAYSAISLASVQDVPILVSGHLAELLFAGLLLYRVFEGRGVPGALERAFLAAFILFEDVRFSWLLITDAAVRQDYEGVTVVGFKMDFSRLAGDYLGIDVGIIATTFLVCCLLTPAIAYLLFRYWRSAVEPALARLRQR